MSAAAEEEEAPLPRMTEAEYLAFEEAAEFRHEFLGGEVRAMSGGTYEHALVGGNLATLLGNRLRGGPCRRLSNDLRIVNRARSAYFYPDASVVCGTPQFPPHERRKITLQNPAALFEVVSPSSETRDRGDKLRSYLEIPSMRLYVITRAEAPQIDFFERREGELWSIGSREGVEASARFDSIGIEFPLAELYEGVDFGSDAEVAAPRTEAPEE